MSYNNHYIVTGSEDRAFYIYDARITDKDNLLYRSERKLHTDTVSFACFMGRFKSVLTGSTDGYARVFRSEYLNVKKNKKGGSNTDKDATAVQKVGRMRSASPSSKAKVDVERTVLRRDNIVDFSPHRDYSMV